jgi:hypothetical protein
MPVFAELTRSLGLGSPLLAEGRVAGPASYATGGFVIDTGLGNITRAIVSPDDGRLGATGAGVSRTIFYEINRDATGASAPGRIRVRVYEVTGSAGYAEVAAATNLSAINFDYIAVGTP